MNTTALRTEPASKASAKTPSVKELQNACSFMDALSQSALSEIGAIAQLALVSLETPEGHGHVERLAFAFKAIWNRADDTMKCINAEAEQVGCNHVDEAERRRMRAHSTSRLSA